MARQQVVSFTITCDVCGDDIADSDADDASRKFSWEGSEYQLDVCIRHQGELSEILNQLKTFADAGSTGKAGRTAARATASKSRSRRVRAAGAASGATSQKGDVAAIRAWALQNGHSVGDRGRIPARVVEAYHQASNGAAPVTAPAAPAPAPAAPAKARRSRKATAPAE